MKSVVLLVLVVVSALAKSPQVRRGRWFRGSYTETKIQHEIVTSLIPSSCVYVAPTLPPCNPKRSLRTLPEFGQQFNQKFLYSNNEEVESQRKSQNENSHEITLPAVEEAEEIGWAEYLGLVAPTVTVTEINLKTTTAFDPRTVITFSIKGCQPSILPLNLDTCNLQKDNLNKINPTKINSAVTPTIFENKDNSNLDSDQVINTEIEPSTASIPSKDVYVPTQQLPNARF